MYGNTHAIDPRLSRFLAMTRGGGRGRHGHHRHGGPRGFGDLGPRGPRARRGDVRAALLVLLGEEPRNGYQLMQEIEQRSDGNWRPSPGSVYPALQQLEDEGLVVTAQRDGRRVYELTDAGRAHVAERGDETAPWDAAKEDAGQGAWSLMRLVRDVALAARQIVTAGDDAQATQAQEVLRETRRSLYRILAEDSEGDEPAPEEA